ncbi:hypothetical protein A33Q_2170 [Indibacter alkaliphilus LW1]|uniref:Uncharacterized protein n=1 Tax=Indibacter alkaliphilus (strain CCUG 57479 / KCTC 22604 / LW1) TaxID=1189612 RepID=S2DI38_INDAL|nr:hypothetical protein A33Q_2170 [Indibacter alkaliphilus LW1]
MVLALWGLFLIEIWWKYYRNIVEIGFVLVVHMIDLNY